METLIKEALKKVGLSEGLWEKISVTSATEIESAVNKLVRSERESKIKEALKTAGLSQDELDKYAQSISDTRVSEAIKTHDAKLKADADREAEAKRLADEAANKNKKSDTNISTDAKDKEISELKTMVGDLVKTVTTLKDEVTGVKTVMTQKERDVYVSTALKEAGIAEGWSKFVTETEPEKIKMQVSNLKTNYETQVQIQNDAIIAAGGTPARSGGSEAFSDQQVAEFAKRQNGEPTKVAGLATKQILATAEK